MLTRIKNDFLKNKVKFAVLGFWAVLLIIGLFNYKEGAVSVVMGIGSTIFFVMVSLVICSADKTINFVKEHSTAVLITLLLLFGLLTAYKKIHTDYAVANDALLITMLIYGALPYAIREKKTAGSALGAVITAALLTILALQKLWWPVMILMYVALATQMFAAALGCFGGKRSIRLAEILLMNSVLIFAAIKLTGYPGIEPVFVPLSRIELVSVILICAFVVASVVAVVRYRERKYFAISAIVSIAMQTALCLASRGNPLMTGGLGLPFVEGNELNSVFAAITLGFVIAPPIIDEEVCYK